MHTSKPADFDPYWQRVDDELAAVPARPEESELALRSTDYATCYAVRLTSIGPYRVFGYLSLPNGKGPWPALYLPYRYTSVVEVLTQGDTMHKRAQYAVFALAARGHRNADEPFAARFPGLLTHGVDDATRYVYRGIVADCCRGAEYLLGRPEIDKARVTVVSHSELSLLVAALRPRFCAAVASPSLFYRAAELFPRYSQYPQEEINDYVRAFPEKADAVYRTLSYFDPLHFAPRIACPTLLWAANHNAPWNKDELEPLCEATQGSCEARQADGSTYEEGIYQERWIAQRAGVVDPALPEHWRE